MAFEWYEDDDTTLAGTDYTLSTTAGTPSSEIEIHAWLNKGSSIGSAETRYLRLFVEDPAAAGTFRTSGLDVLDRREVEIKISGSQNPDLVPGFSAPTTAWQPVGTRRSFQLPAIYPNCCIEIQLRHNPTYEGGNSSPVTFRVKAIQGAVGDLPYVSIPADVTVDGDLDMNSHRITELPMASVYDGGDAASVDWVMARPGKGYCNLAAAADLVWNDLVTNGDFASVLTPWTGTNWAQSAGTALHTAGATAALAQDLAVVEGVSYRVTLTVTGAAGTVTPSLGAVAGTAIAAGAGTVTQTLVAGETGTVALAFAPTTDFDGALDDVTLEEMFYGVGQACDGGTIADGDRILLTAQTVTTENGKYVAIAGGTWLRHPDCDDTTNMYPGARLWVAGGTTNGRALWVQTAVIADYGTDAQVWEKLAAL